MRSNAAGQGQSSRFRAEDKTKILALRWRPEGLVALTSLDIGSQIYEKHFTICR